MTREEAIKTWLPIISMSVDSMPELKEALDMAIKALEQEPKSEWEQDHAILKAYSDGANEVLDKIRAEMLEEMLSHSGTGEEVIQAYADGLKKGLEFIDKYKGESEET